MSFHTGMLYRTVLVNSLIFHWTYVHSIPTFLLGASVPSSAGVPSVNIFNCVSTSQQVGLLLLWLELHSPEKFTWVGNGLELSRRERQEFL